ncbi:hypothetical protein GO013_11260 [Pseudodesulfovibrio sp. JC047]|uniref:hypothetical protein n=1 Tax=Pseudodesulfovibrio sp. JC047 TaxID=2683199 RepID=UPI0013D297AB|nr:hypothetical protein [Pseudodesulfovibrio sp. JC047]NDV20000.1 hypothetical protein [Pseudodesulfovibrio sp. JC047]
MSQQQFTEARQAVALALVTSTEIDDFVASNFPGKTLKVFREVDPGNLPPATECPFVGFGPFTHAQLDKNVHQIEHAMPMGVFVDGESGYVESTPNIFVIPAAAALDELSALVERVASDALLNAGISFEHDPYLPDDVAWGQYFMSFYLYRVRTTRRINL